MSEKTEREKLALRQTLIQAATWSALALEKLRDANAEDCASILRGVNAGELDFAVQLSGILSGRVAVELRLVDRAGALVGIVASAELQRAGPGDFLVH